MNPERFEELYERYCDGELTAEEREEFVSLLGDPALRARFVELSAFEVALSEEHQVASAARERKRGSSRHLPVVRLRRTAEPRSWGPAIAAAVAVAFLGLLAVALSNSRPAPDRSASARPRETRAPSIDPTPEPASPSPKEPPPRPVVPAPPKVEPEAPPPPPEPRPAPPPVREPETPAPPSPKEPPLPAPKPPPPRPQEQETLAFIAQLERVQGDVTLLTAKGVVRAEPGKGIQSGQGIRVGKEGAAALKFADGTLVRLWPETHVPSLADGPAQGKAVQLEHGIVGVDAVKQPANRPLSVITGLAEATVLGTEFVVTARPTYTRLDVREGRVRFARPQGGPPVTVPAGHFAIAGVGTEFASRPIPEVWKAPAAGLQLWLRADKGVNLNGAAVTGWLDASPYAAHAFQRAVANQPVFVPNALGARPAIRFDGSNDFLTLPPGFGNFRAGLSVFFVGRIAASPSGWVRLLELSNGGANDNISFVRKDSQTLTFWAYDGAGKTAKIDAAGAWQADQWATLSVVMGSKGAVTFYRNGVPAGTGTTSEPSTGTRRQNALGKSSYLASDPYFQGEIAEVILYARALPDTERQHVEAYLHSKYLDTTAPPASWPGETK